LRTAVGIQGDQGGVGAIPDEFARCFIEFHADVYHRARRLIPSAIRNGDASHQKIKQSAGLLR
jgi:hypothetical protein